MKKLFALAALVLGLASCQNEPEGLGVVTGGEVDTVVTVAIPEAETRANWNNSAEGVFANGVLEGNATMRYIFQVYYKSVVNGETTIVKSSERQVKYSDGTTVSFPVRLIPNRNYQFVVWADVVDSEDDVDNHYNTADLTNITLNPTWVAMDETRDAFTATYAANNYNGAQSINIELYRPFAKLRVVTTDYNELAKIDVQATESSIQYLTDINVAFNAFAGDVTGETKTVSHNPAAIKTYANETGDAHTIFADYFFAPKNGTVVRFNLKAFDQNDQLIKENNFTTDIPVKANYLTTLKGDVLTDGNNINVEVVENGAFEAENEWPETDAEKLAYAAMFGGEVTLTEDVTLAEPLKIVEGANVVLNLRGKTLQYNGDDRMFKVYGVLSINGEGTVKVNSENLTVSTTAAYIGTAYNNGTIIINGGKHTTNGCTCYHANNGNIVINAGEFEATEAGYNPVGKYNYYYVLNMQDGLGESIVVSGGKFYKYNPMASKSENPVANFCAEGYKTINNGDWFFVVAESVDAVATNDDELQAALADKKSVVLTNDIASNGPLAIYGSVVDGNGNTINANSGSDAYESGVTVAEGTLQNVTVSGAFRALGVGGSGAYKMTGDAYYKNVTTVGATYGFNIGVGNGKKIYVSDSTIGDWNSYSGLSGAEFTNCTFISAGYFYASQRISANATFTYTNCKFEQNTYNNANGTENYYLDSYEGSGTIVLKNCYVGNTLVTAENVTTLFQIDGVTVKVE